MHGVIFVFFGALYACNFMNEVELWDAVSHTSGQEWFIH